MKIKVLFFLTASCLIALAAWLVHRDYAPVFNAEGNIAPTTLHDESTPVDGGPIPEKYRETVHKGLEYLAKSQHKDGHWEGDEGNHPVAMTGLVGLALLLERDGPRVQGWGRIRESKYSANIRKAVDWLMDQGQAGRNGLIFSGHHSETARYMQGHGFATLFLAGAYMNNEAMHKKKLSDVLTGAVKYICKAQSSQGGWYYTSTAEGHDFDAISVTAIQIQALQAAENAGIPFPDDVIGPGHEYLKRAIKTYDEEAKSGQNHTTAADTAAALACYFRSGPWSGVRSRDMMHQLPQEWFKYCQTEIPVGRAIQFGCDELTHYYYAQAVFELSNKTAWTSYRVAMFDHLQNSQNNDGSWPAGNGIGVGPVYSTAVWCTILQLDKRSHPSIPAVPTATS